MFRLAVSLTVLAAASSCSLVFDTGGFRDQPPDAGPGTSPDGAPAPLPDAGPPQPCRVEPAAVEEGATVPVVLTTDIAFASNSTARATIDGEQILIGSLTVGARSNMMGMVLPIPVLADLGDGDRRPLTITVEPSFEVPCSVRLDVVGLDELTIDGPEFQTESIAGKRFSTITFSGEVDLFGTAPARFIATNAIRVNAPVHADGQPGEGPKGGAGGPGSCAGGDEGQDGQCGAGGGRAGSSGTLVAGGGGGGNCAVQNPNDGGGTGGGAGGDMTCSNELVPLGLSGNHGNGGGGGGTTTDGAPGGGGGGSGGVVEMSAPIIVLNQPVTAIGGQGAPGDGPLTCTGVAASGSGGGGSGGPMLLRAREFMLTTTKPVDVPGAPRQSTCAFGGAGSRGRVRIDAGDGTTPDMLVATGFTWQGPMLAADTPRVVNDPGLLVQVMGDPNETYQLQVDADPAIDVSGGDVEQISLRSGLNQVCVLVAEVDQTLPEAQNCLTIAVVQ